MLDQITARTSVAGMQRYEISAYARPGYQCQHNRNYWEFGDYLGIGAGAHSKLSFAHRIIRQVRVRDPQRYIQAALQGNSANMADTSTSMARQHCAIAQEHEIKRADLPFEYMLNALRLREGFVLADFQARTGLPLSAIQPGLDKAFAKNLLQSETIHANGLPATRIKPTPQGFDFLSDLQSLFLPDA